MTEAGPTPAQTDRPTLGQADGSRHPAVARILRTAQPGTLIDGLAGLSGADFTALSLELVSRRVATRRPYEVLEQYRRDRFVRPAQVPALDLLHIEFAALSSVSPAFAPVVPAPVVPLGTHSVLAGVHQNRLVATIRNTEVAADPTLSLALEAAVRRKELFEHDSRATAAVHLAGVQRVVRAQQFDGPRSFAHFSLLGLVSAGRDMGSYQFEIDALLKHITALENVVKRIGAERVLVKLTDFDGSHSSAMDRVVAALNSDTTTAKLVTDREAGREYYQSVCFKLSVVLNDEVVEVGDGGLVDWTQSLLSSKKERLMTSGLSLERLAMLFGSDAFPGRL